MIFRNPKTRNADSSIRAKLLSESFFGGQESFQRRSAFLFDLEDQDLSLESVAPDTPERDPIDLNRGSADAR